jgi:hypothetical protein
MKRWGSEGPPPEAYSRVSEPQRFRPLHNVALRVLEQLEPAFTVERVEGYGLDSELEGGELARPSVRLVPRDPKAAPLAIAFTTFPGLKVRIGRWYSDGFPSCGCDACAETADGEAARLTQMVDDVTAGRFCEAVWVPLEGDTWQESAFWSPCGRSSSRTAVDRCHARQMLDGRNCLRLEWRPWPRAEKVDRAHLVSCGALADARQKRRHACA